MNITDKTSKTVIAARTTEAIFQKQRLQIGVRVTSKAHGDEIHSTIFRPLRMIVERNEWESRIEGRIGLGTNITVSFHDIEAIAMIGN